MGPAPVHEIDLGRAGLDRARYTEDSKADRFELAPWLDVWIHESGGRPGFKQGAITNDIEIGVQIRGEMAVRTPRALRRHGAMTSHVLSPGDRYDLAYGGELGEGCVVGFSIRTDAVTAVHDPHRELLVDEALGGVRTLHELACTMAISRRAGEELPKDAASTLLDLVRQHTDFAAPCSLARARRAIVDDFTSDLYLEHLAEVAGMHRTVFLRRFRERYGTTPVQYRIKTRLNEAARRAWIDRSSPLEAIAASTGFHHRAYFHRAFRAYFGATPDRYCARRSERRPRRLGGGLPKRTYPARRVVPCGL
jgi:AraC-like DNA-binding protein